MEILLNGQAREVAPDVASSDMPLLWWLRDLLGLTGTKYGCGIGACGACTVHLDGQAVRSCVTPMSAIGSRAVLTIEALGTPASPHPLQKAWVLHQVSQCGYCQSGMLMAAAALLKRNAKPSDTEIDAAISNLCRCGTYPRVRRAIHAASAMIRGIAAPAPVEKARPTASGPGGIVRT
ncbi:MAG: (2Fe-2S)-binding protein [Ideonella sp.]